MAEDQTFKELYRFGVNETYIEQFNKGVKNYLEMTKPKEITEPTIIFSDLHANLTALEMTLHFAEINNIDSFISLGDLIEYNDQNDEVLKTIFAYNSKFVANLKGNHDDGVVNGDYFISALFQENIDKDLGKTLLTLPYNEIITVAEKKILLCHSNPWNLDVLYLFPGNVNYFEYFFEKLSCDGFMFGHTHFVTWYNSNQHSKFAFNPGSLGVSRDGSNKLHFSLLNPNTKKIEIYEITHKNQDYLKMLDSIPVKVEEYFF